MERKKTKHKCDGCVWRVYANESKVLCMFSKCVREENKDIWQGRKGKTDGKKKTD